MKHMTFRNLIIVLGALAIPGIALSQSQGSLGYQDADNPSQAVGMIRTTIYAARVMTTECGSRYPDLTGQYSANLRTWESTEGEVLRKAELHWSVMEKMEPKLLEVPAQAETAIKGHFEILERSRMAGTERVVREYCHNYFADLASGTWRKRTPRAYAYIDAAPGK